MNYIPRLTFEYAPQLQIRAIYSLVGWVGHGINVNLSMGLVRVEICGFGMGVGWVVAGWIGFGFSFPTHAEL